ncbi:MAG: hypothetical protein JOZ78_21230 [Chroococcidiopsidaceae cyanobacterium CP_BM_ER_R8_30]|nr:hypothetical protein [Chroococcidiopsidaceae cyanobacterium CP_BM_ER_R8_30]
MDNNLDAWEVIQPQALEAQHCELGKFRVLANSTVHDLMMLVHQSVDFAASSLTRFLGLIFVCHDAACSTSVVSGFSHRLLPIAHRACFQCCSIS